MLVFLFQGTFLFSQSIEPDSLKSKKTENDADINIRQGDVLFYKSKNVLYPEALHFYLKAYEKEKDNIRLNYKIGYCCLFGNSKSQSLDFLLKAYKGDSLIDDRIEFFIALSYQHNYQFDKAIEFFDKYYRNLPDNSKPGNKGLILKKINECKNGKALLGEKIKYSVKNIGNIVNSIYNDYAPVLIDDKTLIFTSTNSNSTGGYLNYDNYQYFEDIYITEKTDSIWSRPRQISKLVNTDSHEAATGNSKDKKILLIYKGLSNGGDLFQSTRLENSWTIPLALPPEINSPFQESSGCFSSQNKFLFFTSNRIDMSFGEHDIFVSKADDKGNWGQCINLGEVINTAEDEDGVFISPDGNTLFFSSKGHNSVGGFDIYKSSLDSTGKWSKPENMGFPINSIDDDICISVIGNGDSISGYFSSKRDGGLGEYDIYQFSFIPDSLKKNENIVAVNKDSSKVNNLVSDNLNNNKDSVKVVKIDNVNKTNNTSKIDDISKTNDLNKTDNNTKTKKTTNSKDSIKVNNNSKIVNKRKIVWETSAELFAKGIDVDTVKGVFFTVQIGAYRKPLNNDAYIGLKEIFFEHLDNGFIRLLTGKFITLKEAVELRNDINSHNHTTFIRAYQDGKPIPTDVAVKLLKEQNINK